MNCCSICPQFFRPITGEGPAPCDYLFVGERPGKTEQARGRVFVGPTGQELDDTYLPLAGLSRDEIHITNAVLCWAENNRTPSPTEVAGCSSHFLPSVFAAVQPTYLILLGGSACRIADFPVRLEMHHGRPLYGSVLGGRWTGWVWPMYHPAAGLREPAKMTALLEDFRHLGEWLRGEWEPPTAPTDLSVDYSIADTPNGLCRYLTNTWTDIACDTENHGKDPFSIQVSNHPGTGRMILAKDVDVVRELRQFVGSSKASPAMWAFHFAQHDLDELRAYGIVIPEGRWQCTMQSAYHQGNLPQGLKPLAYRLLGVTMRSWEDVVWPASIEAWTEWASAAVILSGHDGDLRQEIRTELKTLRCVDCGHRHKNGPCGKCGCESTKTTNIKLEHKIGTAGAVLKHLLRYTTAVDQDLDTPYHPWKKLAEMKENGLRGNVPQPWEWECLEEQLGPMPILGIGNVGIGEALTYGISDADHTLQVAVELAKRRTEEAKVGGRMWVDPEDYDR